MRHSRLYACIAIRRRPAESRMRLRRILHRGPNQQGVFESETVSLGAARLKIIDMEGGDQPILSEDGDTVIVFNGEIYNHLELRRELEQRGHRFRSHSDTETVLNAFLEWDTDCFARMRGMFAVALWTRVRPPPGAGARSHGDQAAVHRAPRRRSVLRLGAEGDPGSSRDRALVESGWSGLLSIAELCARAVDLGGGHRETASRPMDGVAARRNPHRKLLELAARPGTSAGRPRRPKRSWIAC